MRSMHAAATASFLACIAATTFGTSASAAPADAPKPEDKQQEDKPDSKKFVEDQFFYQFMAPQVVYRYNPANNRCDIPQKESPAKLVLSVDPSGISFTSVQATPKRKGEPYIAPRETRFRVVKTIGLNDSEQLVIQFCQRSKTLEFLGLPCQKSPKPPKPHPKNAMGDESGKKAAESTPPGTNNQPGNNPPSSNSTSPAPNPKDDDSAEDANIDISQYENYYCLAKKDFDAMLKTDALAKKYLRASTGPVYGLNLTLPIKIRRALPGFNTTVDKNIQVGGFLGWRWRISDTNDYHVDIPVVSAGLTMLDIAKDTAPSAMTGSTQATGLTASSGIVLDLSNFQLGIMMGVDRATGDTGKSWRYNGKLWYSFGIGYSFLKNDSK